MPSSNVATKIKVRLRRGYAEANRDPAEARYSEAEAGKEKACDRKSLTKIMPRWLGALILLAIGIGGLHQAFTSTVFYIRGEGRVPTWVGRTFTIVGSLLMLIMGLLLFR